ncbi:hypothetical protein AXG93_2587s1360 [Marchantia polymorpha subsp. ruderalis]|uniref:Uncharacterized protein n=1 Tax=Marchantia polymorpha subsp. ruderalis TaxID=1480154 RepID=A0A176WS39_MARPO|nr:hypothetical protein AXG93_2587s1360 [Marchantia polymorpha subsp. ruderalis]
MEGAGVCIVSDDAEHATRGMDSTHEEPEASNVSETVEEPKLPSAVQDLIRRLEGKAEPKLLFHSLIGEPEFREFSPDIAAPSTIKGWRNQVRVRVLEAIGSCNTFEVLNVINLSQLTAREWEIVLRGFMSSTNLREIFVGFINWSSDEAVESFCLQLGRILNSSSVTGLTIWALIQSSSLKDLKLDNLKWGAALLLKALAGDDGNRSIERILLGKEEEEEEEEQAWFISSIRTRFPLDRSLKEVELDNLRMRPQEWQQLGEVTRL